MSPFPFSWSFESGLLFLNFHYTIFISNRYSMSAFFIYSYNTYTIIWRHSLQSDYIILIY